jgi:hypothetical protein
MGIAGTFWAAAALTALWIPDQYVLWLASGFCFGLLLAIFGFLMDQNRAETANAAVRREAPGDPEAAAPANDLDSSADPAPPMEPASFPWRETDITVRAWLVPRYLWATASIEVFFAGERILRTGGQLRVVGSVSTRFFYQGIPCKVELAWRQARRGAFPYVLTIDGRQVREASVRVENLWMAVIPNVLAILLCGLMIYWTFASLPRR